MKKASFDLGLEDVNGFRMAGKERGVLFKASGGNWQMCICVFMCACRYAGACFGGEGEKQLTYQSKEVKGQSRESEFYTLGKEEPDKVTFH